MGKFERCLRAGQGTDPVARNTYTLMMREKYKPALCGGTPCAMIYPFKTRLTVSP